MLSQSGIKIKIITNIIYFEKKLLMNYLKISFCINNILQKMERKKNLKNNIKNNVCYYFDFPWKLLTLILEIFYLMKKKIQKYFNLWNFIQNYFYGFSNIAYYRFNKIDGCIKIYDGIRYLVLFSYLYDEICNDSINHNFEKNRIDLYNYLPEKVMTYYYVNCQWE